MNRCMRGFVAASRPVDEVDDPRQFRFGHRKDTQVRREFVEVCVDVDVLLLLELASVAFLLEELDVDAERASSGGFASSPDKKRVCRKLASGGSR